MPGRRGFEPVGSLPEFQEGELQRIPTPCETEMDSCTWVDEEWGDDGSTEDDGEWWEEDTWSRPGSEGDDDDQTCVGQWEPLACGAYRKLQQIGCGAFGSVHVVEDSDTGERYAAKIELEEYSLPWEVEMFDRVRGLSGFPTVHHYSADEDGALMVMDLLGPNLSELRHACNNRLSLKTVLMIADQVLQRLEGLHSKGLVHRDVKPQNFVLGRGDTACTIHAIDLGLASEYLIGEGCHHIPCHKDVDFVGTVDYASRHAHSGKDQSRRDDLESVCYMLIELLQGELPWNRSPDEFSSDDEWFQYVSKQKVLLPTAMLCKGCPKEFETCLKYCRALKFAEDPDYQYLRGLFKKRLRREGLDDDGSFDWAGMDYMFSY